MSGPGPEEFAPASDTVTTAGTDTTPSAVTPPDERRPNKLYFTDDVLDDDDSDTECAFSILGLGFPLIDPSGAAFATFGEDWDDMGTQSAWFVVRRSVGASELEIDHFDLSRGCTDDADCECSEALDEIRARLAALDQTLSTWRSMEHLAVHTQTIPQEGEPDEPERAKDDRTVAASWSQDSLIFSIPSVKVLATVAQPEARGEVEGCLDDAYVTEVFVDRETKMGLVLYDYEGYHLCEQGSSAVPFRLPANVLEAVDAHPYELH